VWAVYLCGCTDCFLHALFDDEEKAKKWAVENSHNPEGYSIVFYKTPSDIPVYYLKTKTGDDTGWYVE
jgi:hypothetical protein